MQSGAITLTTTKSTKNGKSKQKSASKKVQRSAMTGRYVGKTHGIEHIYPVVGETTRTVKYHPLSTSESREKWRKAIKAVLAKEKSTGYNSK